jgi:TRAP-type C4-dicarboxylate transport system permease small subunit
MQWIRKLDQNFEEVLAVILFTLMVVLTFSQVLSRFVFDVSLAWSEELSRYTFIWLVYISAAMAVKHRRHIRVEIAEKLLPRKVSKWVGFVSDLAWLAFTLYLVVAGADVASHILSMGQTSPAVQLSMGVVYLIIPIGFALMSLRIIQNIFKRLKEKQPDAEEDVRDYSTHV